MFEGFNNATIEYYKKIKDINCKNIYRENERLYLDGVKYPLEELYYELYNYFSTIDNDLLNTKRSCLCGKNK